MQISYRRQWRAECPTELSTRRFQLSGQRDMRTGAVAAGRTCSDIPVAAVPRAALVAWTRPTNWRLDGTTTRLQDPSPTSSRARGLENSRDATSRQRSVELNKSIGWHWGVSQCFIMGVMEQSRLQTARSSRDNVYELE